MRENEGTATQNSPRFAFYLVISTFSVLTDSFCIRRDGDGAAGDRREAG